MLKGIPAALTPDLLWALSAMGHGDTLAVVDANYPAYALHSRVLPLAGVDITDAVAAIGAVVPVDTAVEPAVFAMAPDGEPGAAIESHAAVAAVLSGTEGRAVTIGPVERSDFYELAKKAFAVVLTGETRSYACFVITKGVVQTPAVPR
ncbi:RbsD/FucU family protein [Microlunatus antarcticus]|uniref:L-fucose mutarotase n=1 Tax=Microlunatus antarcticus TaxID=53388 RepID=A0A7W5JUY4_9ACTN|nr:RbsD/FucU domain-containing protein [Microlunatus antarcticus]MBB3326703.1 L-fucose mutarotase [Microlunatus antarcticus]